MNEVQEMLLSYVAARTAEIVTAKRERGVRPLIATEDEILKGIREDVVECMRELVRIGYYQGTKTLNRAALLAKEQA